VIAGSLNGAVLGKLRDAGFSVAFAVYGGFWASAIGGFCASHAETNSAQASRLASVSERVREGARPCAQARLPAWCAEMRLGSVETS
jgi:hypothetical protein